MRSKRLLSRQKTIEKNNDFYKGSLHRKGTYKCDYPISPIDEEYP
jgi:hypothetical protein